MRFYSKFINYSAVYLSTHLVSEHPQAYLKEKDENMSEFNRN